MHILLIHQSFASLNEAGGTRHHELARYLAARGHKVTIIASPVSYLSGNRTSSSKGWFQRQQDGERITIIRAYTYPAFHRSFFHRVLSFLSFMLSSFIAGVQTRNVDLVWGTSPPIFQAFTAWLLARLKRVPFLLEIRDLWPDFAIAMGVLRQPLLVKASLWLERFLYRHADRVMVNSPGFIQHVTQRGARWVELVPNGADPSMFDPSACGQAFRQDHGLGDAFIAIYAGAFGISNDLEVVLEAASCLRDRPDIRFVLLGDGKEKAHLMDKAVKMGLPNVIFAPPAAKNQMADALAAADACIAILKPIPLYATTFPNKVFDYMAAGRPVILAIDGVIRQVVEETQAGIFVAPGDPNAMAASIQRLAGMSDRGRSLGVNGRKCIEERFSRTRLAEQLNLLLEEMRGKYE